MGWGVGVRSVSNLAHPSGCSKTAIQNHLGSYDLQQHVQMWFIRFLGQMPNFYATNDTKQNQISSIGVRQKTTLCLQINKNNKHKKETPCIYMVHGESIGFFKAKSPTFFSSMDPIFPAERPKIQAVPFVALCWFHWGGPTVGRKEKWSTWTAWKSTGDFHHTQKGKASSDSKVFLGQKGYIHISVFSEEYLILK